MKKNNIFAVIFAFSVLGSSAYGAWGIPSFVSSGMSKLSNGMSVIKNGAANAASTISNAVSETSKSVSGASSKMISAVKVGVSKIPGNVSSIQQSVKNATTGIKDTLVGAKDSVKNTLFGAPSALESHQDSPPNAVILQNGPIAQPAMLQEEGEKKYNEFSNKCSAVELMPHSTKEQSKSKKESAEQLIKEISTYKKSIEKNENTKSLMNNLGALNKKLSDIIANIAQTEKRENKAKKESKREERKEEYLKKAVETRNYEEYKIRANALSSAIEELIKNSNTNNGVEHSAFQAIKERVIALRNMVKFETEKSSGQQKTEWEALLKKIEDFAEKEQHIHIKTQVPPSNQFASHAVYNGNPNAENTTPFPSLKGGLKEVVGGIKQLSTAVGQGAVRTLNQIKESANKGIGNRIEVIAQKTGKSIGGAINKIGGKIARFLKI